MGTLQNTYHTCLRILVTGKRVHVKVQWLRNLHNVSAPEVKLVLYRCHLPIHEFYSVKNRSTGAEK